MAIAARPGVLVVSGGEPGEAWLDYDEMVVEVLVQVDDAVELRDGDLVATDSRWLRYECTDDGRAPRLVVLDDDGAPQMVVSLDDDSFVRGHDLMLTRALPLAERHLEIVMRDGDVFLNNLDEPGRTWLLATPGEAVAADSTLAVGGRVLRLHAPAPCEPEPPLTEIASHLTSAMVLEPPPTMHGTPEVAVS
ncbi:MAG: hypothetical protein AB1Z98_31405 [Nannocystaceae bacterium]